MEMWSVAGLIGVSLIATAITGYLYSLVQGRPLDLPDWLVGVVTLIVKHFYDEQSKKNDKNGNGGNGGGQ